MAHSVPICQVYGHEHNSPKCLLCETATPGGRLFLTSLSPSLFSPSRPGHPQEECQAQAAVAHSLFSWTNKSPSLLGYLKCEAKPKASSHYCPWGTSPQSSTLYVTILVIQFLKQGDSLSPRNGAWRLWGTDRIISTQPRKTTLTRSPSRFFFMKLLLANTIWQDFFLTLNSLSSFMWPTRVTWALTHVPP